MIKLLNPLLFGGRMIDKGEVVNGLDPAFEAAIVAAGNGVPCNQSAEINADEFVGLDLGDDVPPQDGEVLVEDQQVELDTGDPQEVSLSGLMLGRGL